MPRKRSWSDEDLRRAVKSRYSIRAVIKDLGLVPAGGNYAQVQSAIQELGLNTDHFTGMGWNKGTRYTLPLVRKPLSEILVVNSPTQSHKLKNKLIENGLKKAECEICGWCQRSVDGRIPIELDHINGDHFDNRLTNLRILCPNCHSLQPTHRGRNKKIGLVNKTKGLLI